MKIADANGVACNIRHGFCHCVHLVVLVCFVLLIAVIASWWLILFLLPLHWNLPKRCYADSRKSLLYVVYFSLTLANLGTGWSKKVFPFWYCIFYVCQSALCLQFFGYSRIICLKWSQLLVSVWLSKWRRWSRQQSWLGWVTVHKRVKPLSM